MKNPFLKGKENLTEQGQLFKNNKAEYDRLKAAAANHEQMQGVIINLFDKPENQYSHNMICNFMNENYGDRDTQKIGDILSDLVETGKLTEIQYRVYQKPNKQTQKPRTVAW